MDTRPLNLPCADPFPSQFGLKKTSLAKAFLTCYYFNYIQELPLAYMVNPFQHRPCFESLRPKEDLNMGLLVPSLVNVALVPFNFGPLLPPSSCRI